MRKSYYHEKQSFPTYLLLLLILLLVACIYFLFRENDFEKTSLFVKGGIVAIIAFFTLILVVAKLKTTISDSGIEYTFSPFRIKGVIAWSDVDRLSVRKYKPIKEYNGWGIRRSANRGIAYTTSGMDGLQIDLKDGRSILLGTKNPEDIKLVLNQLKGDDIISADIL